MQEHAFVPYSMPRLNPQEALARGQDFYTQMNNRRSVRFFSEEPVERRLIECAIRTASTAPSGAHRQPWRFVAVSDPALKRDIRLAAEREERESYERRMSDEWLDALTPLGTDWRKPFLETVPWLVVVFEERHGIAADGSVRRNYYTRESVGIACGLFIAALQQMGLATLTHTPSPMKFLAKILARPSQEKPYILFPVGYPAEDCVVPDLVRKPLEEVAIWNPSESC